MTNLFLLKISNTYYYTLKCWLGICKVNRKFEDKPLQLLEMVLLQVALLKPPEEPLLAQTKELSP